jgi:hypothetical protein
MKPSNNVRNQQASDYLTRDDFITESIVNWLNTPS